MADNFDLEEIFEGMKPEEAQELTARIKERLRGEVDTFKAEKRQAQTDTLRAQYDAEVEAMRKNRLSHSRTIDHLTELKRKYRARGLEIW
jgi:hypothetical protein